jgi:NAD(P)-dependent dehydrogenase (short-subunit alcohol dehydrogenase family)
MRELTGKVIVVTGAGSGIGRALCQALAGKGAMVAACDVNEAAAKETMASLPGSADHRSFAVDVGDRDAVLATADDAVAEFGRIDGVVNNAGVLGQLAPLGELGWDELEFVIRVDLWGVIHGTKALLPHLLTRPEASLVNVSSFAGLMGTLGNSAYFAAKFGVRGFTEAIRSELRRTNVKVTAVFPGVVKTNLAASAPTYTEEERRRAVEIYHSQPGITPEKAASRIVGAIEKGSPRLLIGPDTWFVDKLVRLLPARSDRLIGGAVRFAANRQRPDGRKPF